MDFHLMREARKEAETYLRSFGIDISDQSLGDAMSSYFNIKHKLIEKPKWNVNWAKHIRKKAKALNCLEIILEIERKFKDGGDINPHLSKGVLRVDDHDILLNDWLINHLHLSNTKRRRSDYFFERSNFLLFFYMDQGNVYFIDIRAHGEEFLFAKKELLEIVNENWPEVEEKFRFGDGTMRSTHDLDEEQMSILRARRVGLLTTTEIDGITYMPGSGSSTSGFSVKARREMHGFS